MTIPGWILDIFAAVMLLVAVVSAARLIVSRSLRGGDVDADIDVIDVAHLLMGIAMAGMLTAGLSTLPDGAWEVIFGVLTAWFAWRVYQETRASGARVLVRGCHAPHLVHSAAMVYMLLALTAPTAASGGPGMSGMGGASGSAMQTLRLPTLALLFALLLAGYAVRDLDLLSGPAADKRYNLAGTGIAPAGAALATASALAAAPSTAVTAAGPVTAGGGQGPAAWPEPAETEPAASGSRGASGGGPGAARRLALAPGLETGCRIAMGVTMAFMLIIMI
ncbi:MAG TPA: DUF5134 domain-containing protein [Streptosporangiaceae bacterium]|nr:DUF5134 domain-containing protein [Streptosporangiaceae bacterium]